MSITSRLAGLFKSQSELDLTSGSIPKSLFFLSFPIVITNLLQVGYNLADTFWLGRFSTEAIAAISLGFPLVYLFISLGLGLTVAGSVLVAQHTGAEESAEAEYAASQTVTFTLLAGAAIGAVGFIFIDELLQVFGAEPAVLSLAVDYMEVISVGLPFLFGFTVFIALMRGAGDTITPMLVMLGTVVLNVALDPLLIFGVGPLPRLGVEGAAVATVFSRGCAMAVGLWLMFRGSHGIQIHFRQMVPDLGYSKKLLRIGVPASVENTGRAISVNAVLVIVTLFSTSVIAAFGVGIRVFSMIFMPAIAIDRGVEAMTGQNIGAGREDRVVATNRFAAKTSFLLLSGLGVLTFVFAPSIIRVFDSTPAVVAEGATFLRWIAPTFGFVGILRAYSGGFRGAGKTLTAATIAVVLFGFIRLPIAYVASQGLIPFDVWFLGGRTPTGIWFAFAVSSVVAAVVAASWFELGKWRGAKLTEQSGGESTDSAEQAVSTGGGTADVDPDSNVSDD
ncbi:sodium-driven multidrug efflux pump [Halorubrum californiense DSM 19288]|uniref:Multidrug-efflux transporter n=1 Tax=Halorubrum californiense DSM 19288 TaxID=1227465 RepID=M0E153_9EURY|nr:MATE family efflux transporter [Halorubrum californiense]ELZ40687.1 sodium-driven multidrug efflux pump [Halorubrum californiense DSM 19288]